MRLLIGRASAARSSAAGTTEHDPADAGNVAIGVIAFGMLALLAVGNVMGGAVAEHRAVEDSLAQTRLYWAAMGHANYLLSRTREAGPCPSSCDKAEDMAKESKKLLDEIKDLETWLYPELGSIYQFKPHATVMADPRTYSDGKGRLLFEAHFHTTGGKETENLSALRTVATTRPVELRYCVTDDPSQACGGGDDKDAKVNWIVSIHRPAADPAKL